MSEYTYYEFVAIEQPLPPEAMAHLRACSSRALITPTSFVNHYNWGDLKGNPIEWVKRWFDAYVQVDASGWRQFVLRVRRAAIDEALLALCAHGSAMRIERTKEHFCLSFELQDGEDQETYAEDDGRGWMVRLLPLREELMRGDLRALHLGWLAEVNCGRVKSTAVEPPLPAGLGDLSLPQQALAEFMEVDVDLLAAAAEASQPMPSAEAASAGVEAWLSTVSPEHLRSWVSALVCGDATRATGEAQRLFGAWNAGRAPIPDTGPTRTVAQLRASAEHHRERRLAQEAAARAKRAAEQRATREAQLRSLMAEPALRWQEADRLAGKGTASTYDEAARIVIELSQAYALMGDAAGFDARMKRFALTHERRPALLRRLEQALLRRAQA